MRIVVEGGAQPRGQRRHLARHLVHAAVHQPDAAGFKMRDQHQRGGGLEGIGPRVGGITAIELAQARIVEIFAQRGPQGRERVDREHLVQVERRIFQRQANGAHRRAFHEAGFQCPPDARGLGLEAHPAFGLGRPGKGGHCVAAAGMIGPQIKAAAILPGMARQPIRFYQCQMIIQRRAGIGKDAFEHRAMGEHGGAGIDGSTADIDGAQLATGVGHALHHRHRHATRRQQHGGAQAAHAGSDDDNAVFACQISYPNQGPVRGGLAHGKAAASRS